MTIVEVITALVALGVGVGGGAAGAVVTRRKQRRSDPPTHQAQPTAVASNTGRFDVPFVSREECTTRERAFDGRLERMESKLDQYGSALSENSRALARIEGRLERGQP